MSEPITKPQARAVAKLLTAYADGKQIQWKRLNKWVDGNIITFTREKVSVWLKQHRIKPD